MEQAVGWVLWEDLVVLFGLWFGTLVGWLVVRLVDGVKYQTVGVVGMGNVVGKDHVDDMVQMVAVLDVAVVLDVAMVDHDLMGLDVVVEEVLGGNLMVTDAVVFVVSVAVGLAAAIVLVVVAGMVSLSGETLIAGLT